MKFYVQTTTDYKVTDVITYPHAGYIEIELPTPLPASVLGGAYQLKSGKLTYRGDWDVQEGTEVQAGIDVDNLISVLFNVVSAENAANIIGQVTDEWDDTLKSDVAQKIEIKSASSELFWGSSKLKG